MKVPIPAGVLALAFLHPAAAAEFERDVLPILKRNCFECHKDGKEKGDVNLEPHKIKEHIGSGLAIVPGRPNSGLLMKLVQSDDPDNRMPPKGRPLNDKEVETLKQWILLGAELGSLDPDGKQDSPAPGEPASVAETWTNKEGKEIVATLLRVEGESAVLKMENGKIYRYPIANLSEESRKKLRESAKTE